MAEALFLIAAVEQYRLYRLGVFLSSTKSVFHIVIELTVSLDNIRRQLNPRDDEPRKQWLKYRYVYVNPFLRDEPSVHAFLSFKRTGRLYDEIWRAYLNREYLTTIILCGALIENFEVELRNYMIEMIEKKLSEGMCEEEVMGFFETKTGKKISENAMGPTDLVERFKPKEVDRHSGFSSSEERDQFLKELVNWGAISVKAKGALMEIRKYRNHHVHGNLENVIERYKKDSEKLDNLFGTQRKQCEISMLELSILSQPEKELGYFKEITNKITEKYCILPCQTEIDYVECISSLKKVIDGENLGILRAARAYT